VQPAGNVITFQPQRQVRRSVTLYQVGIAMPLPCRRRWPLLALLLFCTGISSAIAGDPSEFTYRTNPTEVRPKFSAMDQNNHGVATLQASDFTVMDKDVTVRNFQSFTRSGWTQLEIAILIEGSESVSPRYRQEMADILELVSQTAGVPDESLSIFSFAGPHPALVCTGDCRESHAAERLSAAHAGGMTPLFDTIFFAADSLSHHGDVRAESVLIVFSDGADSISRNSLGDAIDAGLKSDVQLDCIDLNAPGQWSQERRRAAESRQCDWRPLFLAARRGHSRTECNP
jgi:hypothetical protein